MSTATTASTSTTHLNGAENQPQQQQHMNGNKKHKASVTEPKKEKKLKKTKTETNPVPTEVHLGGDWPNQPEMKEKEKEKEKTTKSVSRKGQRFAPGKASSYLNLTRYWRHHDVMRKNFLTMKNEASRLHDESKDDEADEAASSAFRYENLMLRLESRRKDVIDQITLAAAIAATSPGLAAQLLEPFADKPDEAEEEEENEADLH